MLVDANLLLYAVDEASPFQQRADAWLTESINSSRRLALPWQSIGGFLRIGTNPRLLESPLSAAAAWARVDAWLARPNVWIPPTTARTAAVLGDLLLASGVTGNLIMDAQLAALAIENGLEVVTADTDFARFPGLRWRNPLA